MFVDRFMGTAMHYPCNYGYIPQTLADDGDPVDVLVITPVPLIAGVVVACRPIGILKMDRRGRRRQQAAGGADRQGAADLHPLAEARGHEPDLRLKAIQHFFEHYKDLEEGKWVKVMGWEGPESARQEVTDGMASWAEAHKKTLSGSPQVLAERVALAQLVDVLLDAGAFARQEAPPPPTRSAGRPASAPRRSPPAAGRAPSCARPARRLRSADAVRDAPGERLVVAGLEVQAGHVLERAPVAAVGARATAGSSRDQRRARRAPRRRATNISQCSGIVRGHAPRRSARVR